MQINCTFKTMTPRGGVKIDDGSKEVWLPYAGLPASAQAVIDAAEEGDNITIDVPERLAKEKGLI